MGFLVGLVVGGLGPRAEVRSLEKQLFEIKRTGSRADRSNEFTRMFTDRLGIDEADTRRPSDGAEPKTPEGATSTADGDPPPSMKTEVEDDDPGEATPPAKLSEADLRAAKEAMAIRAAAARAALMEDVEPTEEQLASIDDVLAEMNDRLVDVVERASLAMRDGEEPERLEMFRLAADGLEAFAAAEEGILSQLTPEQRAAVREEATDPTSFIDARVVDMLEGMSFDERGSAP